MIASDSIAKKDDRKRIYSTLVENGYKPLPLQGKKCLVKGWTHQNIDLDGVTAWAKKKATNVGIRCDGLAAIDLDIYDAELVEHAEHLVIDILGDTDLVRQGKEPKLLMVYRIEEQGSKTRTGRYVDARGIDAEMEILSGNGFQFAAFGNYPGEDYLYDWLVADDDDMTPLNVKRDDLPVVTLAQLAELRLAMIDLFESYGYHLDLVNNASPTDTTAQDLEPGMTFDTVDGELTVAEIKKLFKDGRTQPLRTSLSALRPESDSNGGIFAAHSDTGELMLTDFVTGVIHTVGAPDFAAAVQGLTGEAAENYRRLEEQFKQGEGELIAPTREAAEKDAHDIIAEAVERYAFDAYSGNVIDTLWPDGMIKASAFRRMFCTKVDKRPMWQHIEEVGQTVYGLRNLPGMGPGIHTDPETGLPIVNSYIAPRHDAVGGVSEPFYRFLTHLLPDEAERGLFLEWMAHKTQNPAARLHLLVMIAIREGTGRGTLSKIMSKLYGGRNVRNVDIASLLGRGSQGQYNDFLTASIIVTDEASDPDAESNNYHAKMRVYERLKELHAPGNGNEVMIKRKYGGITQDTTHASILIASNNPNVLPIKSTNRRIITLTNGEPMTTDMADKLYEWMEDRRNIAALYNDLMALEPTIYDGVKIPFETAGTAAMKETTLTIYDVVVRDFLELVGKSGGAFKMSQLKEFYRAARANYIDDYGTDHTEHQLIALAPKLLRESGARPMGARLRYGEAGQFKAWVLESMPILTPREAVGEGVLALQNALKDDRLIRLGALRLVE